MPWSSREQRVIERQAGVAAQAENVLHAMQLQHAHERLGARQLVRLRHSRLPTARPRQLSRPAPERQCKAPLPHCGRGWPRASARGRVRAHSRQQPLTLPSLSRWAPPSPAVRERGCSRLSMIQAVAAPSTGRAAPETNEASSDSRNRAALAISSGLPGAAHRDRRLRRTTSASLSSSPGACC